MAKGIVNVLTHLQVGGDLFGKHITYVTDGRPFCRMVT